MIRFLLSRLKWVVPNVIILTFLLFTTLSVLVGSPAAMLLQLEASQEALRAVDRAYGFDDPIVVQYSRWIGSAIHGDFGRSFSSRQTVTSLIGDSIPITIELALWSIGLSLIAAVVLNTLTARNPMASSIVAAFSVINVTIPSFVLGAFLVLIFSIQLQWLPTSGWVAWSDGVWAHLQHVILPVVTLSTFYFGSFSILYQAEYKSVEDQLFVRVAKAKGISDTRIAFHHVMPNAMLPVIVYVGLCLGQLVGGAVVTEVIFSLPGIGRTFVTAIKGKDFPVILAIGTIVMTGMTIANLAADIVLARINPLVRLS